MNIAADLLPSSYPFCNQTTAAAATLFLSLPTTLIACKKNKIKLQSRLSGGRMNDPIYVNAYMNVTQVFPLIRR